MQTVAEITPLDLKKRLDNGDDLVLLDVREPHELAICKLPNNPLHIPLGQLPERLKELESHKEAEIAVYCRSGGRSERAAMFMMDNGVARVLNVKGGTLAWSDTVDSSVAKY